MDKKSVLINEMIKYYASDVKRINHFMKVYSFAKTIGEMEKVDCLNQEVLDIAAIVHDIGIKPAWEKYNSSNGKYQEELGPAEAIKLLNRLNYDEALIERVAYLVGHHHTYSEIDGLDYQILVEADFLVNLFESESEEMAINSAYQKIFKTNMGKRICRTMFMKG